MCKSHANGSVECFFFCFAFSIFSNSRIKGGEVVTFCILALKDFQLREPGTDRNAYMHRATNDTSLSTPYLVSFEDCRERR